jgi:hypothetical protein
MRLNAFYYTNTFHQYIPLLLFIVFALNHIDTFYYTNAFHQRILLFYSSLF